MWKRRSTSWPASRRATRCTGAVRAGLAGIQRARRAGGLRAAAPAGACCRSIPPAWRRCRPIRPSTPPSASSPTPTGRATRGEVDDELSHADARRSRCRTSSRPPPASRWRSRWSAASRRAYRRGVVGNFWVDVTRITAWLLLPMSLVIALFLVEPGRDPELRRLQGRDHAGGHGLPAAQARRRRPAAEGRQGQPGDGGRDHHHADAGHGPGRLAGGDQDAGHQRRRLLQRQLGASRTRTRRRWPTSSRCWRSS